MKDWQHILIDKIFRIHYYDTVTGQYVVTEFVKKIINYIIVMTNSNK